ncbi:MAG: protein translocase subunit SecF [Elusimicrobiota bacterium]|nr:MAG: protein translocase subunit SecF [Elusimicrobiota bacterium]
MTKFNIDWISKRGTFFAISGTLLAASLGSIATKGFNYGIDFTGGTLVQVAYPAERPLAAVRGDLEKAGYPEAQAQSFGGGKEFALFLKGTKDMDVSIVETFVDKFKAAAGDVRIDRKEYVGPTVGRHLKRQALTAISLALLAIIGYVAFRFDNPLWGAAGVASIAHDVIITAGVFSALQLEVDLVIVAALLTIAGYSINDTIVIYDRMRDNMRHRRGDDLGTLINDSVNEMLSRTIITNGMVFSVVLALFLLGGSVIHNFAFAMLVGSISGTYSTLAVSMPLIYQFQKGRRRAAAPEAESAKPRGGARRR